MSVNPAAANAASAANANAAAIEALVQNELQALANDAQQLQQQVSTGQVVTATVLPSNGLTDLISVLGSRVAASLPPTLTPGDTFTAQVTGFNGPQILLQMLNTVEAGSADGSQSGLGTPIPIPTETGSEVPPAATPASALEAAAAPPVLPEGVTPSMAPPPAVFVAASVRPAAPPPGAPVAAPPPPPPTAAAVPPPPVTVLADIEARLVAARAGQVTVVPSSTSFAAPPPPSPVGLAGSAPRPAPPQIPGAPLPIQPGGPQPQQQQPPSLMMGGRYNIPPTITPSARFNGPPPPQAAGVVPDAAPEPAPTGLAAYREPQSLVRALGLPVTPTNLAAARLAIETPQRLPAALATLESALPQTDDPRVATLRTLTAFIGKIDPASPQLAAQISSYVDNVVTGNETKLVQLLTAQLAADTPAPGAANAEAAAPSAGTNAANAAGPSAAAGAAAAEAVTQPEPALPVLALAQMAERGAALGNDLKTQLLSIVNAPPAGADAGDLLPAASTALTAITSVQMNAAQAMNASPQTMSFTIPMWLGAGYAQARVAIDRDASDPDGNAKALDGDNFHIAFVLDTKNLGTVSVDLQTVGRAFSLAVRTENETSAKRFGENISRLTERLESLRYQVKSAEAAVAPRGATAPVADAPVTEGDLDDGIPSDVNVRA